MRFFLPLYILFCVISCSRETGERVHEMSACEQFLASHKEFVENVHHVECLEENNFYFELLSNKGSVYFATVQGNSLRVDSLWGYDNEMFNKVMEYKPWKNECLQKNPSAHIGASFSKERLKSDSSKYEDRLFSEFKHFIMTVDEMDENDFEKQFEASDSLLQLYSCMASQKLFSRLDGWIRKRDNQSFFIQSSNGMFYTATTNKKRIIAKFKTYTQDDYVPKYERRVYSTDSTFFVEYRNHDWFYFNAARDSIAFFVKDTANAYSVNHYKTNGDTVYYLPLDAPF